MKTTHVKLVFGFDKNRLGGPRIYRKGKGKNLTQAVEALLRQKANNWLPVEQRTEIIKQFKKLRFGKEDENIVEKLKCLKSLKTNQK